MTKDRLFGNMKASLDAGHTRLSFLIVCIIYSLVVSICLGIARMCFIAKKYNEEFEIDSGLIGFAIFEMVVSLGLVSLKLYYSYHYYTIIDNNIGSISEM